MGNGAIFEEAEVQQSAATAAGISAALPVMPSACGILAQKFLNQQNTSQATNTSANAGAQKVARR